MLFGESNIDRVIADLEAWVDSIDFNMPGADGSLGRDVANTVVRGIARRSVEEQRGADATWAPNIDNPPGKGYASQKEKKYGVRQPNIRTGDMLSEQKLYGQTTIEPQLVTMIYGDGTAAARSATGATLTKADKTTTDREKAYYAHTGQGPHGTKRPFYELDNEIATDVRDDIAHALNQFIDNTKVG